MKRLIIFLLLLFSFTSFAQNSLREQFDTFTKSVRQDYAGFRDKANKQYAEYLRLSWKKFSAAAMIRQMKVEPLPPVTYEADDCAPKLFKVPYFTSSDDNTIGGRPRPFEQIKENAESDSLFCFSIYGMKLKVRISGKNRYAVSSLNTDDISDAWLKLSEPQFDNLLVDLLAIRDERHLCDWAYMKLIQKFSNEFVGEGDASTLLSAFLLSQSGYKMRLGMTENKLYLLYGTDNLIFDKLYFNIDGCNYYSLEDDVESDLFIADIPYQGEKGLSLVIPENQVFGGYQTSHRTFKSRRYQVTAECFVDEGKIEFYKTYPAFQPNDNFLSKWAAFVEAPIDTGTKSDLYKWLKFAIYGKSASEATDIILDFIQSAFEYRYDEDVWGTDRVFFTEETLYYPYSDCEDRTIIFLQIVKDLLGLDAAMVYYPNHLAAAVRLPGKAVGDAFILPGGIYSICDPTYIGAPVGKTMPGLDNNDAKILLL